MVGVDSGRFIHIGCGALLQAQGGACFYCGKPLKARTATRDHLVPRSSGRGLPLNKVMACQRCNGSKGHRQPTQDEVQRARGIYASLGAPAFWVGG